MTGHRQPAAEYDLVGVGIGPFNLALAALADGAAGEGRTRALFLEDSERFAWHPGMLLEGTVLQVPFLADLVSLVDPTSRWSFLNYLREHGRLFPFYFAERFHIPRQEYDHYCRWVADCLPTCRFGSRVERVSWDADAEHFLVEYRDVGSSAATTVAARNVVLGVGTAPAIPTVFDGLTGQRVFHSSRYLDNRASLHTASDITLVGSGQSGAEIFLDLLRAQPEYGWRLRWLARTPAFAPMEYSKLGLEHFTPDYVEYFRQLPADTRERLIPAQWQLYKAISDDTIGAIYDLLYERGIGGQWPDVTLAPNVEVTSASAERAGYRLNCRQVEQRHDFTVTTDRVVLATGYAPREVEFLRPLRQLIDWDSLGRYRVDGDYRVALDPQVTGGLYVQNAEMHSHGVGAPDLTLGAWRAARILNHLTGRTVYPLPDRAAFTTFGVPPSATETSEPSEVSDSGEAAGHGRSVPSRVGARH
ncbi:SidA/IucD/PvdA family monooxygenase [Haloechinothrix sp. LS1_15]|uniref:lysine N(6)-hydroxylase/L-ornithine N(5)-oxygenase family protein n=1 Tax=Haloechinothrix sp. LS1_15 TaxID=2652248 RepID=UPI002945FE90|nr:SidA/IucD/PvdA family monooxygenase [Haloechinothrix sp. LS1_15]MDV6012741.1 SidA/IucD/PvdA family monooxygenase [Haloechinothrix sp. LS1_15]